MTKYLCFFICVCLCLLGCQDEVSPGPIEELFFEAADSSFLYSDYDFLSESDFQTVFFDEFSDNENNWSQVDDGDYVVEIANGSLRMESETESLYYIWQDFVGLRSSDFQIEMNFQFPNNSSRQFFAFNWGGFGGWDNILGFRIYADGHYALKQKINDEWVDNIIDKSPTEFIQNNTFNSICIRIIGDRHYFFINEEFVFSAKNLLLRGDEFGPSIGSNSRCEFDNLKVAFIN
ncbi:MAG TPA: hypothetical protein VJ951_05865 [Bacteroidales bacterium]|nr:hypothetical protein [Bacteroidales bacterium]